MSRKSNKSKNGRARRKSNKEPDYDKYVFLPNELVETHVLVHYDVKFLYWVLCTLATKESRIFQLDYGQLSEITGWNRPRISNMVSLLRNMGFVETVNRGRRGLDYYLPHHRFKLVKGTFVSIPKKFVLNSKLPVKSRILWVCLNINCFPGKKSNHERPNMLSRQRLAQITGFSCRTARRYFPQLVSSGYLTVVNNNNYHLKDKIRNSKIAYCPNSFFLYAEPVNPKVNGIYSAKGYKFFYTKSFGGKYKFTPKKIKPSEANYKKTMAYLRKQEKEEQQIDAELAELSKQLSSETEKLEKRKKEIIEKRVKEFQEAGSTKIEIYGNNTVYYKRFGRTWVYHVEEDL